MQTYANPRPQPVKDLPVRFLRLVLCPPSLSFLHQARYVQTSTQTHSNSVLFPISTLRSLAKHGRKPFFAL